MKNEWYHIELFATAPPPSPPTTTAATRSTRMHHTCDHGRCFSVCIDDESEKTFLFNMDTRC